MLGVMRSLKFKLNRKTLNQLYFSYLRPLVEYASVVWDGCTMYEKEQLERFHYEAARIVTGLTRSVSIDHFIERNRVAVFVRPSSVSEVSYHV